MLEFDEGHEEPQRKLSRKALEDYFKTNASSFESVTLRRDSYQTEVATALRAISGSIPDEGFARVLLDVTAVPRFYTASLLVQLFLSGLVQEYVIYYSEGTYVDRPKIPKGLAPEWTLLPVCGVSDVQDPSASKGFLISIGFEENKVNRLTARYAPECVWLLEPTPGYEEEYSKRTKRVADEVLDYAGRAGRRYKQGGTSAPAGDASAALRVLEGLWPTLEALDSYKWTAIPAGPKPHCVAMTLFALEQPEVTLACPAPDEYLTKDVVPNGRVWFCAVRDNTLLPAMERSGSSK
jgi:hypothetical protein